MTGRRELTVMANPALNDKKFEEIRDEWMPGFAAPDATATDTVTHGGGASTPQVVALAVAVVLFGGLSIWIVIRVVSFFSAYGAMMDRFAK